MKIRNIYYIIWADIIITFREKNPTLTEREIKFRLIYLISLINSINLWIVILWLTYFKVYTLNDLEFEFLPTSKMNAGLAALVQYVLPFILINYIFIFRKNRYLSFIDKYTTPTYKWGNIYIYSILIFSFISVLIHGMVTGNIFK